MNDSYIKPEAIIYAFFEIELRVSRPGDRVWVAFFLPEIALAGCKWISCSKDSGGYTDFSENGSFNFDRDQLIMTLKDGGSEDKDIAANRIMIDPSRGLPQEPIANRQEFLPKTDQAGDALSGRGLKMVP